MLILVLSILTSCSLTLIFKLFERYEVQNFQAIVVNYITAAVICFAISGETFDPVGVYHAKWFPYAIGIGLLFISLFNLVAFSAQNVGIAITSVATKISLCFPVLFSYYFFNDSLNAYKVAGIILALISIYFTAKKEGPQKLKSSLLFLIPLILFFSSGCLDVIFVYSMKTFDLVANEIDLIFSATLYSVAALIGIPLLMIKLMMGQKMKIETFIGGVGLGFMNVLSIVFFLKCLHLFPESSFVFPIHNMSIVGLSAIIAAIIFKEKLSLLNIIGIGIALISILMISTS